MMLQKEIIGSRRTADWSDYLYDECDGNVTYNTYNQARQKK